LSGIGGQFGPEYAFEEDELRKNGFSKDNKSQQLQIIVALIATKEGFPTAYDIFPRNTLEGYTIIHKIKNSIKRKKIKELTVVANATTIS
jgi:transposase